MPIPVNIKKRDCDLYCGRSSQGGVASPTSRGWLGNPFKRGERCPICSAVHSEPGSTLDCFERYLRSALAEEEFRWAFLTKISEDTRLGCFCKPKPCHTDVIAKVWLDIAEAGGLLKDIGGMSHDRTWSEIKSMLDAEVGSLLQEANCILGEQGFK